MDKNAKKEEFSYGFLQLLGAKAGLTVNKSDRQIDNQKIDMHIIYAGEINRVDTPRFDVQVKCTHKEITNSKIIDKDKFIYDLDIETYDRLRSNYRDVPIFLIVLLVPKNINEWIEVTEEKTIIKKCAYWISLKGYPKSKNKENIRIKIPKENLLTSSTLRSIIEDIAIQRKELIDKIYQGGEDEL